MNFCYCYYELLIQKELYYLVYWVKLSMFYLMEYGIILYYVKLIQNICIFLFYMWINLYCYL